MEKLNNFMYFRKEEKVMLMPCFSLQLKIIIPNCKSV